MTLLWREIRTVMNNTEALNFLRTINMAPCKVCHKDSEFPAGLCVCLNGCDQFTYSCSAPLQKK